MFIQEVMSRNIVCTDPDEKIGVVAKKMKEQDIGALPVCKDGKLLGIVTDRDIVVRGLTDGLEIIDLSVRQVMSSQPVWTTHTASIEDAVRLMELKQIRRLPVMDREGNLVGMLSLSDIATHTSHELSGEALRAISLSGRPLQTRLQEFSLQQERCHEG